MFFIAKYKWETVDRHLKPPPLEKQFLISPPASPPAGWEQCHEKEPTVLPSSAPDTFELMSRLAALSVAPWSSPEENSTASWADLIDRI